AFAFITMLVMLAGRTAAAQEDESGVEVDFEPGSGVVIESRDDQFSLSIRPRVQLLAELTYPEAEDGGPGDIYTDLGSVDLALQIRRARLTFAGWFFGRDNRFKLELAFSPRDMGWDPERGPTFTPLIDFYVEFRQLRELNVRV